MHLHLCRRKELQKVQLTNQESEFNLLLSSSLIFHGVGMRKPLQEKKPVRYVLGNWNIQNVLRKSHAGDGEEEEDGLHHFGDTMRLG